MVFLRGSRPSGPRTASQHQGQVQLGGDNPMILFLTNDVKIKCNEGLLGFSFFKEREGTYFHSFPHPFVLPGMLL